MYNNVLKNSNDVINRLISMNKKVGDFDLFVDLIDQTFRDTQVYFITNNSTKTRDELVEKARTMNFNVGIVSFESTCGFVVLLLYNF